MPDAPSRPQLLATLQRCVGVAEQGDPDAALAELRDALAWPSDPAARAWPEAVEALSEISRRLGKRGLARALVGVEGAHRVPMLGKARWRREQAARLADVAARWHEAAEPVFAELFLRHALMHEPADPALLGALDDLRAPPEFGDGDGSDESAPASAVDPTVVALTRARNELLDGDIVGARRTLDGVAAIADAEPDSVELLEELTVMVGRAEAIAVGRERTLSADDGRGWHAVRTGQVLLSESRRDLATGAWPVGGRPGHFAVVEETPSSLWAAIDKARLAILELDDQRVEPRTIRSMPGRDNRLFAAIVARRLDWRLVDVDAEPAATDVLVCYQLGVTFGDERRLAERPPGAVAWVHAWTAAAGDEALPDVVSFVCSETLARLHLGDLGDDDLVGVLAGNVADEPKPSHDFADAMDVLAVTRGLRSVTAA